MNEIPTPQTKHPPLGTSPCRRTDLIFRQVEEDFVVYDPVTDSTSLLNASAAAILELCNGSHTVREIAAEIATAFGEDVSKVLPQIQESLADFRRRRFLEPI